MRAVFYNKRKYSLSFYGETGSGKHGASFVRILSMKWHLLYKFCKECTLFYVDDCLCRKLSNFLDGRYCSW